MGIVQNDGSMVRRVGWPIALLVIATIIYAFGFGVEYMTDPLGRSPVLDARENIALAQGADQSGSEPFYRAMLYPWLLSLFSQQADTLAKLATFFGIACHLANASLVGLIAWIVWLRKSAAWLAAGLYGFYPVALYFSVQALDITFSITLFLGSLYLLLRAQSENSQFRGILLALAAGLLGGLTVLARPNFLPAVLLFPVLPCLCGLTKMGGIRQGSVHVLKLSLSVALMIFGTLSLQGLLNYQRSGDFRILPWQGAYNLYAANREGANGKFYKQRVVFDAIPQGMNPTRMESEYLYRQAVGADAELDIAAMNSYWRAELMNEVAADPMRWLGLMGRKFVYAFNDWEQYNNLTYAYHKNRFSLLHWNPLGWGVLILLATSAFILARSKAARLPLYSCSLLALAFGAGLLLFFVSARFRLPLAPFLAIFAGGCAVIDFRTIGRRTIVGLFIALSVAALFTYGNWWDARNTDSYLQDELLLASAAARVGDDAQALKYSQAVLARDASRKDAQRIQLASLFNLWLAEESDAKKMSYLSRLGDSLSKLQLHDASSFFIAGVYAWKVDERDRAVDLWRQALRLYDKEALSSAKALQAVGVAEFFEPQDVGVEQLKKILIP